VTLVPDKGRNWIRPVASFCSLLLYSGLPHLDHNRRILQGPHPNEQVRPSVSHSAFHRASRQFQSPPAEVAASITRSRLKLAGFMRGGNSRKLSNHFAM
jgi:hypothetical protein